MPRAIFVTVVYSVHVEDDSISDKNAKITAMNTKFDFNSNIVDTKVEIFEKWKNPECTVKKIKTNWRF